MTTREEKIFTGLFDEAYKKCFNAVHTEPLSETDSKVLSNDIFEKTGLVIGPKSLKNYSLFILRMEEPGIKKENPSKATLDTISRYVLGAPYTDEVKRKGSESHFPWWFRYSRDFGDAGYVKKIGTGNPAMIRTLLVTAIIIIILLSLLFILTGPGVGNTSFRDDFNSVAEDSLSAKGWIIKNRDMLYWPKRDSKTGHLTLYTLESDNWPLGEKQAGIKNLLLRRTGGNCFETEVHFTDFVPRHNWQQSGIILCEDSSLRGKMIRLSIGYNDFFGGFRKDPEILIQGLSSCESGSLSRPEEIIHFTLYSLNKEYASLVETNLKFSALKIEKNGSRIKFLYTSSPAESYSFRELLTGNFSFNPKYVGIFAIRGWSDNEAIPVNIDSFSMHSIHCGR
ncbi:MAG TPA: hypothetical protein VMT63_07520 [Bacteroidales bacterium]|nr:hypothetical protein [Bacteroidales bacterium]